MVIARAFLSSKRCRSWHRTENVHNTVSRWPTLSKKALDAIQAKRAEQKTKWPNHLAWPVAQATQAQLSQDRSGRSSRTAKCNGERTRKKRRTPLMVSVNVNTPFPEFVQKWRRDTYMATSNWSKTFSDAWTWHTWLFVGSCRNRQILLPTQLCALLNRPLIRAQHTDQWKRLMLRDKFWRVMALRIRAWLACARNEAWLGLPRGWIDFAFPQILGVYQPVLEGEAWSSKRRLQNGVALLRMNGLLHWHWQHERIWWWNRLVPGYNIQNAANFSRFGIVSNVKYMTKRQRSTCW